MQKGGTLLKKIEKKAIPVHTAKWLVRTPTTARNPGAGKKHRNTMKGIIGKKIGMTSVFEPNGKQTACTIIEAGPCVVTQKKTVDTDGYSALQIAYGEAKEKNTPAALINHFAKANTSPKSIVKEIRNCSIDKQ